jgi:hypothetical protein
MTPSMKVHVHWMNLMKNQIIQKFQSLQILKKKGCKAKDSRQRIHFLNHLIKNNFQWVQNVQFWMQVTCVVNNLAKKNV